MTLLCVAPGCRVARHHQPGCAADDCRGCLPERAEHGMLGTACYSRLRTWLAEVPDLHADVVDPPTVVDSRTWVRSWETLLVLNQHAETCRGDSDCRGCLPLSDAAPGRYRVRRQAWAQTLPADPVATPTPAGLVLAGGNTPRVSGSHDPGVSARLNEAGPGSSTLRPDRAGRLWRDDQIGELPAAVLLDSWARDWQHLRGNTETLPPPTVAALCSWLTNRLDWAAQHHPAIDEIYAEIHALHARLKTESGHADARPDLCVGVPCRRCDLLSLWRVADGSGEVECSNPTCRAVYRPDEYAAWTRLLAAHAQHNETAVRLG